MVQLLQISIIQGKLNAYRELLEGILVLKQNQHKLYTGRLVQFILSYYKTSLIRSSIVNCKELLYCKGYLLSLQHITSFICILAHSKY